MEYYKWTPIQYIPIDVRNDIVSGTIQKDLRALPRAIFCIAVWAGSLFVASKIHDLLAHRTFFFEVIELCKLTDM